MIIEPTISMLDRELAVAKRKKQNHFNFAYSVEQAHKSGKPFYHVAVGSHLAMMAWWLDFTAYWSFTLKFYGVDGEVLPVNVNANERVSVRCSASKAQDHLLRALELALASHDDVEVVETIISITMSLTKPKSVYGGVK